MQVAEMTLEEKYNKAMNLLASASEMFEEEPPNESWFYNYFTLTGEHVVRTEEGWQAGSSKQQLIEDFGADYIQEELNAPAL